MPLCAFKQLLVAVIIPPVCTGHDKISSESHYKGSAAGKNTQRRGHGFCRPSLSLESQDCNVNNWNNYSDF